MKTIKDFLVEYVINGDTITDYIAYVQLSVHEFHRLGSDANNNREYPMGLTEFNNMTNGLDLNIFYTLEEMNLYFNSLVRKLD